MQIAHPHSGSSSTWFLVELEFGNVGFWGEGKTGIPGEKPLGARERTNNKFNPHMASMLGVLVLLPLRHPCSPKLQLGEKGNWVSTQVNKLILTWINLMLTCDIDIWIFLARGRQIGAFNSVMLEEIYWHSWRPILQWIINF